MSTNRKLVFTNEQIYHVFNRGIDKRPTFTDKRELDRGLLTLDFYRFIKPPVKLSRFITLTDEQQTKLLDQLKIGKKTLVNVMSYCLMPNHFHLLIKQTIDKGISTFLSNLTNSYTRYFNTKHQRIGPLFEGMFKAVRIESDEQFIHVSRYIHLNPVSSFLITPEELENYQWSSYPEFIGKVERNFADPKPILNFFHSRKNKEEYKKFVLEQVEYARELEKIKHLTID